MAEKENDIEKIKELIEIMKQDNLLELEIQHGDDKISVKREGSKPPQIVSSAQVPAIPVSSTTEQPAATPQQAADDADKFRDDMVHIKAPMVGTFYAAASPDSEAFVEAGSEVNPQTVVCIIEAMKVMNEIKAETNGIVEQVLVKNGQAVEYGQPLFKVRPQ